MKQVLYFIVFLLPNILFAQDSTLQSLERLSLSTKQFSEYNFVETITGVYFNSDRIIASPQRTTDQKNNTLSGIYWTSNRNNKFGKAIPQKIKFHNHVGSFTINDKGDVIIFSGQINPESDKVGLFRTEKVKNKWSVPTLLFPKMINCNVMDPFLSNDGNILLFSSDMVGGYGGLDLYSALKNDTIWSEVKNFGETINSGSNERYAHFLRDTLYFSSDRKTGFGGYDLYFGLPKSTSEFDLMHFPQTVNSTFNDFSSAINRKGELVFASDRFESDDLFVLKMNFPEFDPVPFEEENWCYTFNETNAILYDTLFTYEWVMGDGQKYYGETVDHCYTDTGVYTIELNVFDKITNTISESQASFVVEIIRNKQLDIFSLDSLVRNKNISFAVQNEIVADSSTFYWNFGDGTVGSGREINHMYRNSGEYLIFVGQIYFIAGEKFKLATSKKIIVN